MTKSDWLRTAAKPKGSGDFQLKRVKLGKTAKSDAIRLSQHKIHIVQQSTLRTRDTSAPLSSRGWTLTHSITQANHFSKETRRDACQSIRELLSQAGAFTNPAHVSQYRAVVDVLGRRLCDDESVVRSACVAASKAAVPAIVSTPATLHLWTLYVCTGLTHTTAEIKMDALRALRDVASAQSHVSPAMLLLMRQAFFRHLVQLLVSVKHSVAANLVSLTVHVLGLLVDTFCMFHGSDGSSDGWDVEDLEEDNNEQHVQSGQMELGSLEQFLGLHAARNQALKVTEPNLWESLIQVLLLLHQDLDNIDLLRIGETALRQRTLTVRSRNAALDMLQSYVGLDDPHYDVRFMLLSRRLLESDDMTAVQGWEVRACTFLTNFFGQQSLDKSKSALPFCLALCRKVLSMQTDVQNPSSQHVIDMLDAVHASYSQTAHPQLLQLMLACRPAQIVLGLPKLLYTSKDADFQQNVLCGMIGFLRDRDPSTYPAIELQQKFSRLIAAESKKDGRFITGPFVGFHPDSQRLVLEAGFHMRFWNSQVFCRALGASIPQMSIHVAVLVADLCCYVLEEYPAWLVDAEEGALWSILVSIVARGPRDAVVRVAKRLRTLLMRLRDADEFAALQIVNALREACDEDRFSLWDAAIM